MPAIRLLTRVPAMVRRDYVTTAGAHWLTLASGLLLFHLVARRYALGHRRRAQRAARQPHAAVLHDAVHQVRDADEAGDERLGRLLVDLLGRPALDDDAVVHHRDAIGHGERLLLVVGGGAARRWASGVRARSSSAQTFTLDADASSATGSTGCAGGSARGSSSSGAVPVSVSTRSASAGM